MYLNDIFTIAANLTGAPALSIPCGFDRNGLPIGLQLQGAAFSRSQADSTSRTGSSRRPTGTGAFPRWRHHERSSASRDERRSRGWEVVIGLETHAQLSTASKIFSGASTAFGAAPNTQASAVDIALPGVLPVLNRGAVERAIRFGLAVGATINRKSVFARKNYFYPDLPKGYQISQYESSGRAGRIAVRSTRREAREIVRLTRAHLEEDAGKSLHEDYHGMTGIDLNRAGTPLLEIVSEPDLRSAADAVTYAKRAARARQVDRHLRRQHAGGQLSLRRQRVGAPRGRDEARHPLRDQESEQLPLHAAGDRVRGAAPDRADRRRRHRRPGDAPLRSRPRRDAVDAQQGRRAGLPLLPRSRSAAARDRRRVDRARAKRNARIARGDEGALRRRVRACRRRTRRH